MLDFKSYINENYDDYSVGDIVLIRYWLTGDVVPVKLIEKVTKNYFMVSHKIEGSLLFNAPDHGVKKSNILGKTRSVEEPPFDPNKVSLQNPNTRPNTSGIVPGWNSWNNDIAF